MERYRIAAGVGLYYVTFAENEGDLRSCLGGVDTWQDAARRPTSSLVDEISPILNFGVEGLDLLDLVEDGIQYGRPVYRQVKYAFPLGGYEYAADGLLQLIDDRTSNLTPDQRIGRGVIRAGESFVTDAASVLVGGASAGA